jgi:hypothetical protein
VLLGQHERHDTTRAPGSVTDPRRHWIVRYLNGRFVRLPERVEVLVRDLCASRESGQLLPVHGERHHVEWHAIAAGVVELSDAIARWWGEVSSIGLIPFLSLRTRSHRITEARRMIYCVALVLVAGCDRSRGRRRVHHA